MDARATSAPVSPNEASNLIQMLGADEGGARGDSLPHSRGTGRTHALRPPAPGSFSTLRRPVLLDDGEDDQRERDQARNIDQRFVLIRYRAQPLEQPSRRVGRKRDGEPEEEAVARLAPEAQEEQRHGERRRGGGSDQH